MSESSIGSKIVPAAIALVVGLGAAGAATAAVVNSFSPDDTKARNSGPAEALPPEQIAREVLGYGE
jgi:hypothetical protein